MAVVQSMTGRPHSIRAGLGDRSVDAAVVVGVLVICIGHDLIDGSGSRLLAVAFDVLLALPLLGRRRRPTVAFLLIAAVALVQWSTGQQVAGDIAILAALYGVGSFEIRRPAIVLAAAIAEVGVVLAVIRWAPASHVLGATVMATGTVSAALVLGIYMRTRRAYIRSVLERADTAERERDQQALVAAASERARISAEMHDIVAHSLSVMIALNDGAAAYLDRDPAAARSAMGNASALGRQALGEMRRLLGTLDDDHADLTPQPGLADLDELVEQVRAAGLAVDLVVTGSPPDLPASAQLTVYRTVQEALTNVLKHAPDAARAVVTLRYSPGSLDMDIENDGPSSDPAPARTISVSDGARLPSAGRGLTGMRARAAVFHGTVEAAHRSGGGWRVSSHLNLGTYTP